MIHRTLLKSLLPAFVLGGLSCLAIATGRAQAPGTRDTGFVESGFFLKKIVALPDGRYLGLGADDGNDDDKVHRFLADGSVDGSFVPPVADVTDFLLLPDGKILIGGTFDEVDGQPHRFVARMNENGRLDASFNPDLSEVGSNLGVNQLLRQKNGKIIVDAPHIASTGYSYSLLSRLNVDGSLDRSFETSLGASFSGRIRLQSDDKIIVAGEVIKQTGIQFDFYRLGRLNADGTTDTSFRAAALPQDRSIFFPADMLILPDDRIVTGGSIDGGDGLDTGYVLRYSADGVLDTGFNVTVTGPPSPEDNTNVGVSGLVRQTDGKILLCGEFTAVNGVPNQAVARLNADGTTDAAFSALGTFNDPQGAGSPDEIALQAGGKVLLSGALFYKGGPDEGIIRLLNDDSTVEPPPTAKLADLQVGVIEVTTGLNKKGTKIKVKGEMIVQNSGKKTAKGVVVGAFVSADTSLSADDIPLSTVALADLEQDPVKKNTSTGGTKVVFKGGAGAVGSLSGKYVIFVVDPANTVKESNDTNNTSAAGPLR